MLCQALIKTINGTLALLPNFKTAFPHSPYEMKTISGAPQQQYETVDCDTDKVPSNISGVHDVTLPHLSASSGAGAEDEMMYETVTD